MKRFKVNNVVARLQDYLGDPIDLYFLVLKKLDEDIYKFNRSIGCHSYRCGYNYRKSLKSKKRMYKKTLKSLVIRRCYDY